MVKAARFLTVSVFCFIISSQGSQAYGFEYGQCLLGRAESFNNELKEYKNIALAKAAIKKLALEQNSDLLKWNYATTKLIYDLVVLKSSLVHLNNIYDVIRSQQPNKLAEIQNFFDGSLGHAALAQVDSESQVSNEKSVSDLLDLLQKDVTGDSDAQKELVVLKESIESQDWVKDALGDLYDRIQEASVGATPVEPDTITQWIALADFFEGRIAPSDCVKCLRSAIDFGGVMVDWKKNHVFPPFENFRGLWGRLPSLFQMKYPKLADSAKEASKVINYYYSRTMESFLFSRAEMTQEYVSAWVKKDPNYKIILAQANNEPSLSAETNIAVKLFKYIQLKERVLSNAFDHFVWNGQEGTALEKSIDGVARTLYGEAESCELSGASQFEAIGSIIAARSITVDQENQEKNIFLSVANFGIGIVNVLSPLDIQPFKSYKTGASDFGRMRELTVNPIIADMATPAQVVSRPGQFSVWKIGKSESYEISRWIHLPSNLGYPADIKTIVAGPQGADVDPAQRKVLCPNNDVFQKAVEVAKQLVTDYPSYANKYRFYQNRNRVIPYFYTHGANVSLSFVPQLQPRPNFVSMQGGMHALNIYEGPGACKFLKLYQPKSFKVKASK
ncbi:MAG: hypothetical protein ACXVCN_15655 [Bdellovibrio sp.]